jgi:hypothetical protein
VALGRSALLAGALACLSLAAAAATAVSNESHSSPCDGYALDIGADAPFATARPAVSGDPVQGGAMGAADGTWSGTPALTRSWLRCDGGGAACEAIPGAAGSSYTPTAADVGMRIRVRSEQCAGVVAVRVSKQTARKLKLKKRTRIARGKLADAPAGQARRVRAKQTRAARRALRRRKAVRITLVGVLTDPAGNRATRAKRAKLVRPRR